MIEKVTLQLALGDTFVTTDGTSCEELNPKMLLLMGAAKCAGLTVLHILKKEKMTPIRLEIAVSGNLSTEEVHSEAVYQSFHVAYNIACASNEEQAKASRAVRLTHEKYCGMLRMLRMIAPVSEEIAIVTVAGVNP